MRAVGIKMLKNRLSEYVRIVKAGETVLVTDRDRVVAELVPPRAGRAEIAQDALLAEAVRKGWLSPPVARAQTPPGSVPVTSLDEILAGLETDRGDGAHDARVRTDDDR